MKQPDIINNRYGFVVVLERLKHETKSIALYKCRCDCGQIFNSRKADLLKYKYKSCGCYKRVLLKARCAKEPKQVTINSIFLSYKNRAKKGGFDFQLDKSTIEKLLFANCYYCNSPPSNFYKSSLGITNYSGLDRIDNKKGYILDNCVSCCAICNKMKQILTTDEFYTHIKKIISFRNL